MTLPIHIERKLRQLERHKKFQIIITTGMMAGCSVAFVAPDAYVTISVINLITSIVWIWEK